MLQKVKPYFLNEHTVTIECYKIKLTVFRLLKLTKMADIHHSITHALVLSVKENSCFVTYGSVKIVNN